MLVSAYNVGKSVYFSRPVAIGSAVICALPALEYGFAAIRCLDRMQRTTQNPQDPMNAGIKQRNEKLRGEALFRAAPAAVLATAAFNPYPGTAAAGAIFFYFFAKANWRNEISGKQETMCFSPIAVKAVSHYKKQIIKGCYFGIKWTAIKCHTAVATVFGWGASGVRAIGRGCAKLISLPVKGLKAVGKGVANMVRPIVKVTVGIFKHPKAAAVGVVGAVCLFTAVRYRGVAGAVISPLFRAATFTVGVALLTAKNAVVLTGRAITYVPSVAYHTVKFVVNIPVAVVKFAVR